jgi:hypothetical protein
MTGLTGIVGPEKRRAPAVHADEQGMFSGQIYCLATRKTSLNRYVNPLSTAKA